MESTLNLIVFVFLPLVVLFVSILVKVYRANRSSNEQVVGDEYRVETTSPRKLSNYRYSRKRYIMTSAENNLFRLLKELLGDKYEVLPQVHISTFIDHKVGRQDYRAALSVVQRKSVDYLICTREYCNPLLAIELDDKTHQTTERVRRDALVKEIFADAGMPLLRIKWQSSYNAQELQQTLALYLQPQNVSQPNEQ